MTICFVTLQSITDLWALVKCLSGMPVSMVGETSKARVTPRVQNAVVKQARGYLEKSLVLPRFLANNNTMSEGLLMEFSDL